MPHLKQNRYSLCLNLLNSFTEKEMKGLTDLVSCGFFNTDAYVVKLLSVLKRQIIGRCEMENEKKILIYNSVFKDSATLKLNKAQQGRLYAKLNLLTRLSEEFLIINAMRNNKNYQSDILAQQLLDKNQYWLFDRHLKKMTKKISGHDGKSYELKYKLSSIKLNRIYKTGEIYYKKEDYIDEIVKNLDLHYLITKLDLQLSALSVKRITQRDFDNLTYDSISNLLKLKTYASNPLIKAQLATVNLLSVQDEKSYIKLLETLQQSQDLSKFHLRTFYYAAVNFCTQQIIKGKFKNQVLIELYQKMHQEDLLINENFMSENMLKNMINTACRAKRFEWAKYISEYYHNYIRKEIQDSVYNFNLGLIEFGKKNYDVAINHFVKADHINLTFDVNCRVLILRSHYELDKEYDERTVTIFRSAEKFFAEHKTLPKNHKRGYKNFVHILTNLYRRKHQASKMSLERIKASIEKSKVNIDKTWLNEKVKELE